MSQVIILVTAADNQSLCIIQVHTAWNTQAEQVTEWTHLAAWVVVAVPLVVGVLSIRHVVTSAKYTSVTLCHTYTHTVTAAKLQQIIRTNK